MRVTWDFFVTALSRRVFAEGGFAAVIRKGAADAGAIFLLVRDRQGLTSFLGPAPQSDYEAFAPTSRRFVKIFETDDDSIVASRIERELKFDSDAWFVELDTQGSVDEIVDIMKP